MQKKNQGKSCLRWARSCKDQRHTFLVFNVCFIYGLEVVSHQGGLMRNKTKGKAGETGTNETVGSETNCQSLRQDKPEHHSGEIGELGFSSQSWAELRIIHFFFFWKE